MFNIGLNRQQTGFTLIELIVVLIILSVLAIIAVPKFSDISSDAKINKLENIAAQMRTTNKLVQAKAIIKGLVPTPTNSTQNQIDRIVEFEFGSVELHFSSLCPEALGEMGDQLDFINFMNISLDGDLDYRADNQYVRLGFDIPASGVPVTQGCYVRYDSFNDNCEVTVYTSTC